MRDKGSVLSHFRPRILQKTVRPEEETGTSLSDVTRLFGPYQTIPSITTDREILESRTTTTTYQTSVKILGRRESHKEDFCVSYFLYIYKFH